MQQPLYLIRAEQPEDFAAIDTLNDEAFGPGRFTKAAYRLREHVPHDPALSFAAIAGDRLIGSVRLTPIRIGERPALLLGPLAVRPDWSGKGAGKALVRTAMEAAARLGHAVVLLVGDEPYYGQFGFRALKPGQLMMPGPADPHRVLVAPLREAALDGLGGAVTQVR